jgi:Rieske Fe-S protein
VANDTDLGRRKFFEIGIYAITCTIALVSTAALTLFTIGPAFKKKRSRWVEVKLENPLIDGATFARVVLEYETKEGWLKGRARRLAYLKRDKGGQIVAISAGCTHLGCIVTWDEAEKIFKCPCHDGRFDVEGKVIGGPPPAPLKRHKTKTDNGKIYLATETVPLGGEKGESV